MTYNNGNIKDIYYFIFPKKNQILLISMITFKPSKNIFLKGLFTLYIIVVRCLQILKRVSHTKVNQALIFAKVFVNQTVIVVYINSGVKTSQLT